MIIGAHFLLYSKNLEADRAFFRDILEFHAIDLGRNWLLSQQRWRFIPATTTSSSFTLNITYSGLYST